MKLVVYNDTPVGTFSAVVHGVDEHALLMHNAEERTLYVIKGPDEEPWQIRADRWEWEDA